MTRSLLVSAILIQSVAVCRRCAAQDSTCAHRLSCVSDHLGWTGPSYQFTGKEDSALLAAVITKTFELGKEDAGRLAQPFVFCISLVSDSSMALTSAVIEVLRDHNPPIRPAADCEVSDSGEYRVTERATGRRAWLGYVTALRLQEDRTVLAWSHFYVGPLFAAGWVCSFRKEGTHWQPGECSLRWIA